jgi:hypothetical protein
MAHQDLNAALSQHLTDAANTVRELAAMYLAGTITADEHRQLLRQQQEVTRNAVHRISQELRGDVQELRRDIIINTDVYSFVLLFLITSF